MSRYIYQQTIVQWRTKVEDDGTIGNPEIIKKFTTEIKGSQNKYKKQKQSVKSKVHNVEYLD